MADVNRGSRPLSPHLTIYRPQWSWVPSIMNRITGVGVVVGAVLIVWWLFAAATGPDHFETANGVVMSWFGQLVLVLSLLGLSYHTVNSIRHLWWDMGYGMRVDQVERSAQLTVALSVVLTIVVLVF